MSEEEEFQFRARLEAEQAAQQQAPAPTPVERFNAQQKRMGLGKQGDTMGDIRRARDQAVYDLGGKVTDVTGSPGAGSLANAAADVATDPLTYAGGLGGKVITPIAEAGAKKLMASSLKPTWESWRTGKAAKAIETMLEEGFNATRGGVDSMKAKIADLNDEIAKKIAMSPATVDKAAVADRLRGLLDKFTEQVKPNADTKAIQDSWTEFLQHPLISNATDIPVQLAQKLKQGTYTALGKKSYGELKGAEVEAQKALARGLKEEISAAVPEVAPLNARESSLINATNVAERRAMLQDNNNLGGLVWLAHDPVAALGFMADKSALAKSWMARGLYSGVRPNTAGIGASIGGTAGFGGGSEEGILSKREAWLGGR